MKTRFFLLLLVAGQAGCSAGNLYTSPRALSADELTLGSAVQAGWTRRPAGSPFVTSTGEQVQPTETRRTVQAAPSLIQVRRGLGGGFDAGLRLTMLDASSPVASIDLKAELRRGAALGVALAPSATTINTRELRAELPALVGLRVGSRLELVASPGVGYRVALEDRGTSDPMVRAGLGLRARLGERWALFPEVSASRVFASTPESTLVAGLGVELTVRGMP